MEVIDFPAFLPNSHEKEFKVALKEATDMIYEELESGELTATRAIVVLLNDKSDNFDLDLRLVNCRMSEVVSILDISKSIVKREMGY